MTDYLIDVVRRMFAAGLTTDEIADKVGLTLEQVQWIVFDRFYTGSRT